MIRIEIKSTATRTINYTNKTTGKPASMEMQDVFVYLPNAEGQTDSYDKIEVAIDERTGPTPTGNYTLTPQCIYLDRNRRLSVSLRNMKAIQGTLKAAA